MDEDQVLTAGVAAYCGDALCARHGCQRLPAARDEWCPPVTVPAATTEHDGLSRRLYALAGSVQPVTVTGGRLTAGDATTLYRALVACAEHAQRLEEEVARPALIAELTAQHMREAREMQLAALAEQARREYAEARREIAEGLHASQLFAAPIELVDEATRIRRLGLAQGIVAVALDEGLLP